MIFNEKNGLKYYQFESFCEAGITHGFFTRLDRENKTRKRMIPRIIRHLPDQLHMPDMDSVELAKRRRG